MGKSNQQCLLEEVEHAGVAQGEDSMIQERKSVLSSCEYPNKRLNRISTKIIMAFLLHFRKGKVISKVYQFGGSAAWSGRSPGGHGHGHVSLSCRR